MIERIMFDEFLECDFKVCWLGGFQLFNIGLPLEKLFLETEVFDRDYELIRGQLNPLPA